MADVTYKNIKDFGFYQGPNSIPGIKFHHAAKDLGVTAWGMNVVVMEPNCSKYPEHDHATDGQEEAYLILEGSATLTAGDFTQLLKRGDMVRIGPKQKRKFVPGKDGVTFLAIGNTPGQAYKPKS